MQPKQGRSGFATYPSHRHWFVNDADHPYNEVKRFDLIRGYQGGGRSITWGRQSYRLSDEDFSANLRGGIAVDWPVRYKDIAPWYDYVKHISELAAKTWGLSQLPDGKLLFPMQMNCPETFFQKNS